MAGLPARTATGMALNFAIFQLPVFVFTLLLLGGCLVVTSLPAIRAYGPIRVGENGALVAVLTIHSPILSVAQALYLKGVGDVLDGLVGATATQPCNEEGKGDPCDSGNEPAHHAAGNMAK